MEELSQEDQALVDTMTEQMQIMFHGKPTYVIGCVLQNLMVMTLFHTADNREDKLHLLAQWVDSVERNLDNVAIIKTQ